MRHSENRRGGLRSVKLLAGTGVLLGGLLLLGVTPGARADDCQERIVKADHKLHQAGERHGWESKQAAHARHELAEARRYCWEHGHRWWDVEGSRWHTDRDWDDRDHDHR
jgi:hypothetical protein